MHALLAWSERVLTTQQLCLAMHAGITWDKQCNVWANRWFDLSLLANYS